LRVHAWNIIIYKFFFYFFYFLYKIIFLLHIFFNNSCNITCGPPLHTMDRLINSYKKFREDLSVKI